MWRPASAHTCCLFSGHSIIISTLNLISVHSPEAPAPMAGRWPVWPGTKSGVFSVWWLLRALGHIFRLQRQASVSVSAPLSSSAVHSSIIYTLCYSQGASHSIQSLVSCDTDNNQQPPWRSLTARSSNKTPRPPRRGIIDLEIRVSK